MSQNLSSAVVVIGALRVNRMTSANLNLHIALCLPYGFRSIQYMFFEERLFEEFQNGCLLGCPNETVLSILSFHVALVSPTKFWFNIRHMVMEKHDS